MNKFIFFTILILLYLALAKTFQPTDIDVIVIKNRDQLADIVRDSPATVIFTDSHEAGFVIKTYYHKYRIVYGFNSPEEVIVKTSKKYAKENEKYLGLSLYRIYKGETKDDSTPVPPGFVFVDDPSFGRWRNGKDGSRYWNFYRAYHKLPSYLGWRDFSMTKEVFTKTRFYVRQELPFFGNNNIFGPHGKITQKNFPHYFDEERRQRLSYKNLIYDYLKENFIPTTR